MAGSRAEEVGRRRSLGGILCRRAGRSQALRLRDDDRLAVATMNVQTLAGGVLERLLAVGIRLGIDVFCLQEVAAGRQLMDECTGEAQNLKDREILEFLGETTTE